MECAGVSNTVASLRSVQELLCHSTVTPLDGLDPRLTLMLNDTSISLPWLRFPDHLHRRYEGRVFSVREVRSGGVTVTHLFAGAALKRHPAIYLELTQSAVGNVVTVKFALCCHTFQRPVSPYSSATTRFSQRSPTGNTTSRSSSGSIIATTGGNNKGVGVSRGGGGVVGRPGSGGGAAAIQADVAAPSFRSFEVGLSGLFSRRARAEGAKGSEKVIEARRIAGDEWVRVQSMDNLSQRERQAVSRFVNVLLDWAWVILEGVK